MLQASNEIRIRDLKGGENVKKLIVIVVLLLLTAGVAWAWTDWNCVQRCMNRGGMYEYCVRHCT